MLFPQLLEILDPEPHDAFLNMAIDEVLLYSADTPTLRRYRWSRPSVSFGYFGSFAAVSRLWPGRDAVRRWTGGGIVPHGEDLTYTLIVPAASSFFRHPARESYRLIHEALARHLSRVDPEVSVAARASEKISDACFENPVAFDLVSRGAKIGGAAQRRTKKGLLHQGSIQGGRSSSLDGLSGAISRLQSRRPLDAAQMNAARRLAKEKYAAEAWLAKF